jgi:hypothetical protein
MQLYTVYLYLETALHVSGGTFTHYQERKQLYLQHLVFVTPLLLPAAIVEELELLCSIIMLNCTVYKSIFFRNLYSKYFPDWRILKK